MHGAKKPLTAGAGRCVEEGYLRKGHIAASAGPASERVALLDEARVNEQLVSWRRFDDVLRWTLDAEVEAHQLRRAGWVSEVLYPSNVFSGVGDAGDLHYLFGRLDLGCEERRSGSRSSVGRRCRQRTWGPETRLAHFLEVGIPVAHRAQV